MQIRNLLKVFSLFFLQDSSEAFYPGINSHDRKNVIIQSQPHFQRNAFGYDHSNLDSEMGKDLEKVQHSIMQLNQKQPDSSIPDQSMSGNLLTDADEAQLEKKERGYKDMRGLRPNAHLSMFSMDDMVQTVVWPITQSISYLFDSMLSVGDKVVQCTSSIVQTTVWPITQLISLFGSISSIWNDVYNEDSNDDYN